MKDFELPFGFLLILCIIFWRTFTPSGYRRVLDACGNFARTSADLGSTKVGERKSNGIRRQDNV